MNETIKKILKFLSRSLGFFFINLSILLLVLAFFANSSVKNIDVLKNDLINLTQEKLLNNSQDKLEQAREYCKNNQNDENCKQLNKLNNGGLNLQLDILLDKHFINPVKLYFNKAIILSIFLVLIGFGFIYLGTFDLLNSFYKLSVHLTISNIIFALFFNYFPNLINKTLNSPQIQNLIKDIPKDIVDKILNIMLEWLNKPIIGTFKLTITLGIIFLIISAVLYFVKRKALKVNN
jgi:hypothetical protein